MKRITSIAAIIIMLQFIQYPVAAQNSIPFQEEINNFKKADSAEMPPQNAILFVGSSSIRKWVDVQSYFPGYTIINRGFGGSTLLDLVTFADDIIFPYHAKQIVIYCGENDFANDTVSGATVAYRFETLFDQIRNVYKDVPIAFISFKPSPSREKLMPKMEAGNEIVKAFLATKQNTAFIDVYHPMLTVDNKPLPDIFVEDNLHMNVKGYTIWQQVIKPYLLK